MVLVFEGHKSPPPPSLACANYATVCIRLRPLDVLGGWELRYFFRGEKSVQIARMRIATGGLNTGACLESSGKVFRPLL